MPNFYVSKLYKFLDDEDDMYKKESIYIVGSNELFLKGFYCLSLRRPLLDPNKFGNKIFICAKTFPTNNAQKIFDIFYKYYSQFIVEHETVNFINNYFNYKCIYMYRMPYIYMYKIIKYIEKDLYDDKLLNCLKLIIVDENKSGYHPFMLLDIDHVINMKSQIQDMLDEESRFNKNSEKNTN